MAAAAAEPVRVALTRGAVDESVHVVHVAVVDGDGDLRAAAGDAGRVAFLRSAAKPLQALPLVESGAADAYGLGAAELAVACASHAGSAVHQGAVRSLLGRAGLDEGALRCGIHPPADAETAQALARAGERPRRIHHNCSGKHAGMLAVCAHRGWALDGYLDPLHPLQQEIRAILAEAAGAEPAVAVDGCGVPTFALPLWAMARAYARLAAGRLPGARAQAAERLAAAMAARPDLVSGPGRPNTVMLEHLGGRVLTKGGAEGVWCAGLRGPGTGLGVALKVQDGADRAAAPAMLAVLLALGLPGAGAPALGPHARPPVVNTRGEVVGATRVDVPPALRAALQGLAATA